MKNNTIELEEENGFRPNNAHDDSEVPRIIFKTDHIEKNFNNPHRVKSTFYCGEATSTAYFRGSQSSHALSSEERIPAFLMHS